MQWGAISYVRSIKNGTRKLSGAKLNKNKPIPPALAAWHVRNDHSKNREERPPYRWSPIPQHSASAVSGCLVVLINIHKVGVRQRYLFCWSALTPILHTIIYCHLSGRLPGIPILTWSRQPYMNSSGGGSTGTRHNHVTRVSSCWWPQNKSPRSKPRRSATHTAVKRVFAVSLRSRAFRQTRLFFTRTTTTSIDNSSSSIIVHQYSSTSLYSSTSSTTVPLPINMF